jgi:hypothetical protein
MLASAFAWSAPTEPRPLTPSSRLRDAKRPGLHPHRIALALMS